MMKKCFQKCLALTLALVMLLGMLPLGVFATEETSPPMAYVWFDDRNQGRYFHDAMTAWNAACEDGHILLMDNWKIDRVLTVPEQTEVQVFMNGCSIDRGLTSAVDSGEVFLVRSNSSLKLHGTDNEDPVTKTTISKVTGGYNNNGGGGIHIQTGASVYLYGVTVTGNATSERSGGGGVRLQGDGSCLYMDPFSAVEGNSAPNGDGGGVSMRGKGAKIEGGSVKNNTAGESGGGISTHAESCTIASVTVTGNTVGNGKKGGGIYMAEGSGCAVFGCTVKKNTVPNGNGGGIYVDGNGGSLAYSVIQENTAMLGGGVYVDVGDTLALSGDLTVKDNISGLGKDTAVANLFLATTSQKAAYLSGYPSGGELHIGWDTDARSGDNVQLTAGQGAYNCQYMISDVPEHNIYWSWLTDDGKNDRRIRSSTVDYRKVIDHTDTDVPVADRYTIYEDGYLNGYDLQEGIYSYKATSGGDLDAVYYYSDGYFLDKPEFYNEHLATMSLAAVMATFNSDPTEFDESMFNDGYANRFRNAKQLLSDIGIKNEDIHISDTFMLKPTDTSIGVIMGAKELSFGKDEASEPYILLPIIVRGAGYGSEWASNVTLGESGEAAGFSNAADQVMAELEKYLASELSLDLKKALSEGRVKFWVGGFSRAAATANLVAKRLTDTYGETNSIYAYCFETPKGGVDATVKKEAYTYEGQYLNIHNIINSGDIVPFVGPKEMGFKRYGVDHYVPGSSAGEVSENVYTTKKGLKVTTYSDNVASTVGAMDYAQRREEMMVQLALLDDTIVFDDYFSLATMNYVGNAMSDKDMVGPLKNGTATSAADWIPRFIQDLVQWAANGTYSWSTVDGDGYDHDYRRFYSTNTTFSGKDYVTVEQALQTFTKLLFGMDDTEAFMEAMMYRMSDMASDGWLVRDFYIGVIAMWDEQAQYRQRWYINDVWNVLTKDMTYPGGKSVPSIKDFVGPNQQKELEDATYALLAFLFLFVCRDYDAEPPLAGVDTEQIHLGTLLYNISSILQCHYPEVCMAWLRTYDYHYTNNDLGKYEDTAVHLVSGDSAVPPQVNAVVTIKEKKSVVTLTAPFGAVEGVDKNSFENGAAIYYQIYKNGTAVSDWQLYQDPIVLQPEKDAEYFLKAYSVRFQTKSDLLTVADGTLRSGTDTVGSVFGEGSWLAIGGLSLIAVALAVAVALNTKRKKAQRSTTPSET